MLVGVLGAFLGILIFQLSLDLYAEIGLVVSANVGSSGTNSLGADREGPVLGQNCFR